MHTSLIYLHIYLIVIAPAASVLINAYLIYENEAKEGTDQVMVNQLFQISQQMNSLGQTVSNLVDNKFTLNSMKEAIEKIDNVDRAYVRYLAQRNSLSKSEFIIACQDHSD